MKKIITLTTDFGLTDSYVGVMKGVILSINEDASIVDITHDVNSHSIIPAAYILNSSYKYFPPKSVHVVVVDPGVGSDRRAVLLCADNHYFIGPDNGVFSNIYKSNPDYELYELENSKYFLEPVSNTFHGRDIFSPCAAYLSSGVKPDQFGKKIVNPVIEEFPDYYKQDGLIRGSIAYIDKFGNLITNIPSDIVDDSALITVGKTEIKGVSAFYSTTAEGEILAIKGSSGYLEISVNKGSAKRYIGIEDVEIRVEN